MISSSRGIEMIQSDLNYSISSQMESFARGSNLAVYLGAVFDTLHMRPETESPQGDATQLPLVASGTQLIECSLNAEIE
jgi:hypothetical protein